MSSIVSEVSYDIISQNAIAFFGYNHHIEPTTSTFEMFILVILHKETPFKNKLSTSQNLELPRIL